MNDAQDIKSVVGVVVHERSTWRQARRWRAFFIAARPPRDMRVDIAAARQRTAYRRQNRCRYAEYSTCAVAPSAESRWAICYASSAHADFVSCARSLTTQCQRRPLLPPLRARHSVPACSSPKTHLKRVKMRILAPERAQWMPRIYWRHI